MVTSKNNGYLWKAVREGSMWELLGVGNILNPDLTGVCKGVTKLQT